MMKARINSGMVRLRTLRMVLTSTCFRASACMRESVEGQRIAGEDETAFALARHALEQPVERVLIGELPFMAHEGTVAGPEQALGEAGAEQRRQHVVGGRSYAVGAGGLDP